MATIFELVSPKEIAIFYEKQPTNDVPYLGPGLFPSAKKNGIDLSWIKGSSGLPVAIASSAFDAHAPIRERIGVASLQEEMPFFRERMVIKERDRQELLRVMDASNQGMLDTLLRQIYDDRANLIRGVDVSIERMRMQILSTGKVFISDNGVLRDINYGLKRHQFVALKDTHKWSDIENSTPVEDILDWQQVIEDETGETPRTAICSKKTWRLLLKNKSIKEDMVVGTGNRIITMTESMLEQYLLDKTGVRVIRYTKKYAEKVGGTAKQFFPDNVFTLIPSGALGKTWYGTTPEEADLLSKQSNAEVEIVNTGVAVMNRIITHPVNVETFVSAVSLPSFEAGNKVLIATVA